MIALMSAMISSSKKKMKRISTFLYQRRKLIGKLFLFIGVFCVSVLGILFIFHDSPLLSPITSLTTFQFLAGEETHTSGQKVVYGFLPYWNVTKITPQPELTHLAYFGLTIGSDGNILTQTEEGTEPGYQKLKTDNVLTLMNQMQDQQSKVEVVFAQFNNDDIATFLLSPAAHQNFLRSLDSVLLAYPVAGINIDIEYSGEVTPQLRNAMSSFMRKLNTHIKQKYEGVGLSIDMYASAAKNTNIWDVPEIAQSVDYIIIMAYDFHRRSSSLAGPVAPLFGGNEHWDSDITQHLREFMKYAPRSKLVLGIPFYGYEWQTTSRNSQAHTYPKSGSTATVERVQELLAKKEKLQVEEQWNEAALSPYLSYKENGQIFVVYYENSRSISYKLDLVNQLNLAGVAIWALGYEKDSRELWDVIQRKM